MNSQVFVGLLNPPICESLQPSNITVLGSRAGASLADWMVMPVTTVGPIWGVTANPDGAFGGTLSVAVSKFRYFAWVLSMALATPSEPEIGRASCRERG